MKRQIERFLQIMQDFRKRRALRHIREHALAFGYDLSELTDKQIEMGIRRLSSAVKMSGHSAHDVARAMEIFGRTWDDHLR